MKYKKYEFTFDKSVYDLSGVSVIRLFSKLEQVLRTYTLEYLQYLGLISICRSKENFMTISDLEPTTKVSDKRFDKVYHEFAIVNKDFDYIPLGVLKSNKVYLEQISTVDLKLNLDTLYKLTIGHKSSGLLTFTNYEDACDFIDKNNLTDMFVIAIPYKNITNAVSDLYFNFNNSKDVLLSSSKLDKIDLNKYESKDVYVVSHNDLSALKLDNDKRFELFKTFRDLNIYKYTKVEEEKFEESNVSKNLEHESQIVNKSYPIIDGNVTFGDRTISIDELKSNIAKNGYREDEVTKYNKKCLPMILIDHLETHTQGEIESVYISDDCDIVILIFREKPRKPEKLIKEFLVLLDKHSINNFKINNRNRDKVKPLRPLFGPYGKYAIPSTRYYNTANT